MNKVGLICALSAAFFNSLMGIFSVNLLQSGMSSSSIAFYKCFLAMCVLLTIIIGTNKLRAFIDTFKYHFISIMICAFCGFFMLSLFETLAYRHINVPTVVFIVLGSATVSTFVLKIFTEKVITQITFLSISLAVIGLSLIFNISSASSMHLNSLLLAILAGIGYSLFLFLCPKFKIQSNIYTVTGFLVFACIYLLIPMLIEGSSGGSPHLFSLTSEQLMYLFMLAIFPTILGFWFTIKALSLMKSSSVQLLELCEPVFAIVLAYVFLSQSMTIIQIVGGSLILLSIYLSVKKDPSFA